MSAVEVGSATFSVDEAAVLLGVSRSHAYDLVRRGEFPVPVIRLGRTVRVPRAALNNLLGVS